MTNVIRTHLDTNVGNAFMHISNADLMSMARELGHNLGAADNDVRLVGNERRASALITLKNSRFELPGDGAMYPIIMFSNWNDGTRAMRITVGLFRLVCSNGLMASVPGMSFDRRIIHRFTETNIERVKELPVIAAELVEYLNSGDLQHTIEMAKDTPVRDAISVIGSLPVGQRAKDLSIDRILLNRVRPEDDIRNAWGVYNLVNESVRSKSRSEFTALTKDEGLLSHVLTLAAA